MSTSTGITPENVLLFLEDGGELKDEILLAMYERGGQGGQSEVSYRYTIRDHR